MSEMNTSYWTPRRLVKVLVADWFLLVWILALLFGCSSFEKPDTDFQLGGRVVVGLMLAGLALVLPGLVRLGYAIDQDNLGLSQVLLMRLILKASETFA